MSKLFTFYNTEIEDSALITVWESPNQGEYIAGWDGFERSFFKSEIDDKVKKGVYQVVEDFRLPDFKFKSSIAADPEYIFTAKLEGSFYRVKNISANNGLEYTFSKGEVEDKIESGEYEIVEDFRKQPSKTVEDVTKLVLEREMKQGGIIWKLNNKKVSEDLFTITVKHSLLDGKEFKSAQEAIEYLQALEKVFGSH